MRLAIITAAVALACGAVDAFAQRVDRLANGLVLQHMHRASHRGGGFDLDAVTVDLCNARFVPRITAPGEGPRTVSSWARAVGAIVAVNGDYFDETTMRPLGPVRSAGTTWPASRREHRDALLAFDAVAQPHMLVAPDVAQPTLWNDAAAQLGAWPDAIAAREQVLRDGHVRESPAIVHDGERHPRTALAFSADRHTMWFVVVDGRREHSTGATTDELAEALRALGARDGFKLDGGGSSTLYVRGRGVLNHPSDGHERVVATHVGIVLNTAATGSRAWCASSAPPRAARPNRFPASAYASLLAMVAACIVSIRARRL